MLNKELEWINSPQKARQAKSRARVTAYEVCFCCLKNLIYYVLKKFSL